MKKLIDYAPEFEEGKALRISAIVNKPIVITEVAFKHGNYGPYCVFVFLNELEEPVEVMTSSKYIVEALHTAAKEGALPVEATFIKKGNAYYME